MITNHSIECQKKIYIKDKDIKEDTQRAYAINNLKNELFIYLNNNPLTKYRELKKYGEDKLITLDLNILIQDNFFKNIYNLSFKWYSIFENNKTRLQKIYIRENFITHIYPKFVYHKEFSQLLVILFYYDLTKSRYRGLYFIKFKIISEVFHCIKFI